MKKYFITGIGTDIGKTVVSAILCEAWGADYWKPIQAGELKNTDAMKVKKLVSNRKTRIHPEAYLLSKPMSPHAAAALDGIEIDINSIRLPKTKNTLIIEGCGGLMVPLNKKSLVIDLIPHFNAEVILVSRHYLGSINHTLMSVDVLKSRNIKITGIVFIGNNPATEEIIMHYSGIKCVGRIGEEKKMDRLTLRKYINSLPPHSHQRLPVSRHQRSMV